MARGEQIGRQWIILQILLNSKFGVSVSDLAKKVDCHTRTVYRDIDALQIAGFPLYNENQDGKNIWFILDSAKENQLIPLSTSELMALYFSRDLLIVLKNTVFHDSLKSLVNKIKATLPNEYLIFLEQFEKNITIGLPPYKTHTNLTETLQLINKAVEKKKCIDISYFTISRKKDTERRVAPYNIWFADGTFYLIGHCMLRGERRTFACDRIKSVSITDQTFLIPEDFVIDEYVRSSFGVFHGTPTKVKIWFAPEAACYIKEKTWHESQSISEQEDGSILFEAQVAGVHDIKIWVMSWGSKAKVIEPESLKDDIKSEINSLVSLYD